MIGLLGQLEILLQLDVMVCRIMPLPHKNACTFIPEIYEYVSLCGKRDIADEKMNIEFLWAELIISPCNQRIVPNCGQGKNDNGRLVRYAMVLVSKMEKGGQKLRNMGQI